MEKLVYIYFTPEIFKKKIPILKIFCGVQRKTKSKRIKAPKKKPMSIISHLELIERWPTVRLNTSDAHLPRVVV